ncbi:MAG: PEP-CTERM sorting domain-containing protein [Opitutaceae bacterium]|nr:PEP-CTERM sorting domain-containing protein [Opitutaceae bacterium]
MDTEIIPLPCSTERVRSLKTKLLAAAPLAFVAFAATTKAGVDSYTPGSPNSTDSGTFLYFDPDSTTTTLTTQGADIGLRACGVYFNYDESKVQFVSLENGHLNLISFGTAINSSSTFTSSGSGFNSLPAYTSGGDSISSGSGDNVYVGYRYVSAAPGGYSYGWLNFDYTVGTSILLNQWALENGGAGLTAGAVPEPATTAMLGGLMVFGFVLLRHRCRAWWRRFAG